MSKKDRLMDKKQLFHDLTDFIFVANQPCAADIVLVPGGSHASIMEKACELLLAGYAPYVLPSGGYNPKLQPYASEFDCFKEVAINLGIAQESILQEDKATNTLENARFSRAVIAKQGIKITKALLVCKNYHARRALMTYQHVFGPAVDFIVVPTLDKRQINKENWFVNPSHRALVLQELVKIGQYFQQFSYANEATQN